MKATLSKPALDILTEKVENLNKRAVKNNLPLMGLNVREVGFVPFYGTGFGNSQIMFNVELSGCIPRINGWGLVARIEFTNTIGAIVKIVPGVDDDGSFAKYRDEQGNCEHCNTNRRRNDVFVVEHTDGRRKVVGRNCLADFIRTNDVAGLIARAKALEEWTCEYFESEGGRSGGKAYVPLASYVSTVSMLVRKFGWASRTACKDTDEQSTADCADYYYNATGHKHNEWVKKNELYTSDNDKELAENAIKWASEVDASKSEYLDVIKRIAQSGEFEWKLDGYVASIICAYQKDLDRQAKLANSNKSKGFIGKPKERIRDLLVTVVRVRYFEGNYGTRTIVAMEHKLTDDSVAPITWFASGSKDFEEGTDYNLTATIKEHTEDNNWGKQTIVQRATLYPINETIGA